MNPYKFVIKSVPLPKSEYYRSIKQVLVYIWGFDASFDSAQEKATAYVKSLNWHPLSVKQVVELSREQISHFQKDEELLFQQAFVHGIAANFFVTPIREKPPCSSIEY